MDGLPDLGLHSASVCKAVGHGRLLSPDCNACGACPNDWVADGVRVSRRHDPDLISLWQPAYWFLHPNRLA